MNFNKVAVVLCVVVVIGALSYFFVFSRNGEVSLSEQKINTAVKFIPYEKRMWETYSNSQFKYSLEIPAQLSITQFSISSSTAGSEFSAGKSVVGFGDSLLGNFGVISIAVHANTPLSSIDQWLKEENKKYTIQKLIIEKRIFIDGSSAIVTYLQSDYEPAGSSKNEKTTVFIKNGNLFEIMTRFAGDANHEKVWNTFKFY